MEKPLSVKREEFVEAMVSLINGCGLPAFAVLDVLRNISCEVENLAKQQYEIEKKQYEESMKESAVNG